MMSSKFTLLHLETVRLWVFCYRYSHYSNLLLGIYNWNHFLPKDKRLKSTLYSNHNTCIPKKLNQKTNFRVCRSSARWVCLPTTCELLATGPDRDLHRVARAKNLRADPAEVHDHGHRLWEEEGPVVKAD